MLYILTGVDGAGKSTCFEVLKRYLGNKAIFVKESYTPSVEDRIERIYRALNLAESDKVVIYDRASVIDDFVYEPILQKKPSAYETVATSEDYDILLEVLRKAKIIHFTCDDEVLKERLEERGDEYISFSDVKAIKKGYAEFFSKNDIEPYVLDTTHSNIITIAAHALQIVYRKPFRLAHIVPQSSLHKIEGKGYQMCLANIVHNDSAYASFYSRIASEDEAFVLLDNGAAEGQQLGMEDLLACYENIKPNEVVLPDTLCNSAETLTKGRFAIERLRQVYGAKLPFTLMGVPQGRTFTEWAKCAEEMIQWPELHCLGVSKFLQMETQDEYVRYYATEFIEELIKKYHRYDIEVHLLGCSESPQTIAKIAKAFPFVRGCDSAYGYICTQANVEIYEKTTRPSGEIDFIYGRDYDGLSDNLTAFEIAVGVLDNNYDKRWRS